MKTPKTKDGGKQFSYYISSVNQSRNSSELRAEIVAYALQFIGNPYKWGGTSLTKGADCSGFTQSVFKKFNIHIPRTSKAQATGGKEVALVNRKPGDLIFYRKRNAITHVALYIGNNKVISAGNKKTGIHVTDYNYKTPFKAVSYID